MSATALRLLPKLGEHHVLELTRLHVTRSMCSQGWVLQRGANVPQGWAQSTGRHLSSELALTDSSLDIVPTS